MNVSVVAPDAGGITGPRLASPIGLTRDEASSTGRDPAALEVPPVS